jgi:hypothetical protein
MQYVRPRPQRTSYADVAQLVEHHLAKVDVASSNLVVRSLLLPNKSHLTGPPVPGDWRSGSALP